METNNRQENTLKAIVLFLGFTLVAILVVEAAISYMELYLSLNRLIFWNIFLFWVALIVWRRIQSRASLFVGFLFFVLGSILVSLTLEDVGEVFLRFSLMGYLLGLAQEFAGRVASKSKS